MASKPKVKICGISNLADARYCAGAGADYLGFVLYEKSPRFIEASEVRQVVEWLHGPKTVGVFVNHPTESVNAIADKAGFDFIQASGEESPEWCEAIEQPVIKAIHVFEHDTGQTLWERMAPYENTVAHFLLDTGKADAWGGTGSAFDWGLLKDARWRDYDLFLAGGLSPDNIVEAVGFTTPYAVDVSSGLEEAPGRKDFALVDAFFRRLDSLD